jgi:hypothetical protein
MARRKTERQYLPFNSEELSAKIEKFNAFREGNTVSTQTEYGEMAVEVSSQYRFFDFKTFSRNVIDLIAAQQEVFYYSLHIRRGVQEIDLLTNPVFVGDEVYYQSLSLLNSNDRSRALQFNAGLMRWNDNHSFIVPLPNASTSERAIHKGKTFEEKVESINGFVDTLPTLMSKQLEIIEKLGHKNVSVKSIIKTIFAERREGVNEVTVSALNRAKAFLFRLQQNMKTSEIEDAGMSVVQIPLLKQPLDFTKSSADLVVNLYEAFLWYTEIFKNRDTAVINRESNRFFDLVEGFEIFDNISETEENELA